MFIQQQTKENKMQGTRPENDNPALTSLNKETQQSMFDYEDTPLFSGTAQTAKPDTFTPRVIEIQDSMFSHDLKNINKGLANPYNTNTR